MFDGILCKVAIKQHLICQEMLLGSYLRLLKKRFEKRPCYGIVCHKHITPRYLKIDIAYIIKLQKFYFFKSFFRFAVVSQMFQIDLSEKQPGINKIVFFPNS